MSQNNRTTINDLTDQASPEIRDDELDSVAGGKPDTLAEVADLHPPLPSVTTNRLTLKLGKRGNPMKYGGTATDRQPEPDGGNAV
jgi:hypothetical protein